MMFKRKTNFEDHLTTIQNMIDFSNTNFISTEDIDISKKDLTFLKAKGLININKAFDNELRITLTDKGITYFDDKKEARKQVILSWSVNFVMAVLSAVCGSVLTLIIQYALIK